MATSRIVFSDFPNAPRNSRVERGFSVSSHRAARRLHQAGAPRLPHGEQTKEPHVAVRFRLREPRAASRQLSYAGPTSITIPILVAVVPVPVASWLLNPFGSLRRGPYRASLVPISTAGLVPRLSADFMNCIDVHDWPYGRSCGRHFVDRC